MGMGGTRHLAIGKNARKSGESRFGNRSSVKQVLLRRDRLTENPPRLTEIGFVTIAKRILLRPIKKLHFILIAMKVPFAVQKPL